MTPSPDHQPGLAAPGPPPAPYGPRLSWSQMPARVHQWAEQILGAPVAQTASQRGGFSPGVADRVRTTGGQRAFIKACGTGTNDRTPALIADEAHILSILPAGAGAPALLGSRREEVGGEDWALLVTEDVEGRHPHTPWETEEIEAALAAYRRVASTPVPLDIDLPTLAEQMAGEMTLVPALAAMPPGSVDLWVLAHLDDLTGLVADAPDALAGDAIVHLDARSDNLLVIPDSTVRIVDWPWACVGAPWMDSLALGINARLYDPGADVQLHLEAVEDLGGSSEHVNAVLAVLLGLFWYSSAQPPPPGLPTVRAFQRAQARVVTTWLRSRVE